MRSSVVFSLALSFMLSTAAAQGTPQTPSRWTLSAGPGWAQGGFGGTLLGGRLRAEYDLVRPTSPFRLRLEAATFWSPTRAYLRSSFDGSTAWGVHQGVDLMFGLSTAIAPLPRARFSPYVMLGVYARQRWTHGSSSIRNPDGSFLYYPERSRAVGDILLNVGIGIRTRIGGRTFQLEMRPQNSLTFGTTLPF